MSKPMRFVVTVAALLLLVAGLVHARGNGMDDLRVVNNFPYPVTVRFRSMIFDDKGALIGEVPPYTVRTFSGAGGITGDEIPATVVVNTSRKMFLNLDADAFYTDKSPVSVEKGWHRLDGSVVWSATLGLPSPQTVDPAVASTKRLLTGCFFAGFVVFIGWIEWRAHKNEKLKQTP